MQHYIAIDIGASSGRLMHATLQNGKISLDEIHRFKNGFSFSEGHDRWDIDFLIQEIFAGLEKVKALGIEECTIGIDTWGVDYVMIDRAGKKIADPISYRDTRTRNKMNDFCQKVSKETIYEKTGIQFMDFNTLYQLYVEDKNLLAQADKLLFIPDYIGYVLTEKMVCEVTNASTTQMLNLRENCFDAHLLEEVNVTSEKFATLVDAGTPLGNLAPKWHETYDLPKANVITVATHDTASAVLGVPKVGSSENWAYISSGTWSLIGIENKVPINTAKAYEYNFTNEWGAFGTYRVLKNIMGLWMVQEIQRLAENGKYSFAELASLANETPYFTSVVDVNNPVFTNPENMIEAIQTVCKETNQPVPETVGELVNCVYSSLAKSYQQELAHIEEISGKKIEALYIVGGGSNVAKLNQLTANLIGIPVYAGPGEATAIGNLALQMIANVDVENVEQAREIIFESFEISKFIPQEEKITV